jgi:hypothetical protein
MANRHRAEMTAKTLGAVASLFLGDELLHEVPLNQFRLDHYHPGLKRAYEYDGPEHYCEVGHIERDERKALACQKNGIMLQRWPYYFQLTRDVAQYIFREFYSANRYVEAIALVYGTTDERRVLAPGLHWSKNTPANFVHRGMNRFSEIDGAPESVRSQVVRSFQIYRERLGTHREWLLFPENDGRFITFMKHQPEDEHLNRFYPSSESPQDLP